MGTCSSCSGSYFVERFLFGTLLVGLVCLLVVVGNLGSGGGGTRNPTTLSTERVLLMQEEHVIGRDKTVKRAVSDFNYMSKRRVPNGPDPIHNRRAGNSGGAPGQA